MRSQRPHGYTLWGFDMKVCMVAYTFYDADNRVRRYAEALAKRGDHVDVVALRQEGEASESVLNGVHIYRIQKRIVNEKAKFTFLFRLLLFLLRSMLFLARSQLRDRYDLIHVHNIPDFEVFSAIVPKLMGSKVILDIHDLVPEFYSSKFGVSKNTYTFRLLVAVEGISVAFANHVIAPNHIWQKRLEERSVTPDRCTTILNFPDTDIFRKRGRNRADNKLILLYPGTLNFHQGLDIAIRAFALIEKQAPEVEFHIYGGGDQAGALMTLITELGLTNKVFLKGSLPLEGIARVIENADLGVVPKRKDGFGNEAFSTKILEFMSLGIPVIVPDTMIDRYYFNDKVARFFHANDETSLAEALLLMIKNHCLRETLARNASEFAEKYSWDANKKIYFDLVDSLVHSSNDS
jgi:glycosyltransferase involved in cell wall biosynthesis